jgi:aryl-alcohol dehydrogenase-like predicted oxidoreductase
VLREGKIKYIGLSEISSSTLRRACKIVHVDAVEIEYSAFVLDIEGSIGTNLLSTCRELGVAIVAYSPLGRGLLTGALSTKEAISGDGDYRAIFPRFAGDNLEANAKIVRQFNALAEKKGCTLAQLAIAWLLKQGDDVIPIPGTKRIKYLEENWASLEVQLTNAEEKEIREFVEKAEVAGDRMPEGGAAQCFVDTVGE